MRRERETDKKDLKTRFPNENPMYSPFHNTSFCLENKIPRTTIVTSEEQIPTFGLKNFSNVTEQGLLGLWQRKPNSDRGCLQQRKGFFAGWQAKRKGSPELPGDF